MGRFFYPTFRLASLMFGRSYAFYRVGNWVYRLLGGRKPVTPPLDYSQVSLVAEGYTHSGNSFLRANIEPGIAVATHVHHAWSFGPAVAGGIPTILLIRDPLEVAKSWHYRSGVPLWFELAGWIFYYRDVWRYRDNYTVVPFEMLVDNFYHVRSVIEKLAPNCRLKPQTDYGSLNRFEGTRHDIKLSAFDNWLLRRARALHCRYLMRASITSIEQRRSHLKTPQPNSSASHLS